MNKRGNCGILNAKKRNTGFTLAELLIVVAIIGVLVAIAIPLFTSQLEKSRKAVCMNERDTMRRAAAMAVLTDDVNWKEMKSDEIIAKLKGMNRINEFKCQSGGTITAEANADGTAVTFSCSKHDGSESGNDGKSSATKTAQQNLVTALEAFFEKNNYGGYFNNQVNLNLFFGKGYKLAEAKPSDVLTDDMITTWMNGMSGIDAGKKDSILSSIQQYRESTLTVVPYVTKQGQIITYYTKDAAKFGSDNPNFSDASMICVNGTWYGNSNMNWNQNAINPNSVAFLNQFIADESANKQLLLNQGWIPLM